MNFPAPPPPEKTHLYLSSCFTLWEWNGEGEEGGQRRGVTAASLTTSALILVNTGSIRGILLGRKMKCNDALLLARSPRVWGFVSIPPSLIKALGGAEKCPLRSV